MEPKKIIIIEDEMIHGLYLKSSIEHNGYRVIDIVPRGEEALDKAVTLKPDLIITDILLKDSMTGIEVIEKIIQQISIPFIYITALTDNKTIEKAELTRPFAIIYKPYEMKNLIETIHKALD